MRTQPLLYGTLLLLIAALAGWYFYKFAMPAKNALFSSDGKETPGVIVNMREEKSGQNPSIYYADVAYEDQNGRQYTIRNTYRFDEWYSLKQDGGASVRYLKSNPFHAAEIHSIQGKRPVAVGYVLVCAAFAVPGALLLLTGISRPHRPALEELTLIPRPHSRPKSPRNPLV